MQLVKLKYLCRSFSTPIMQQELSEEGKYKVYGASGLVGYKNDFAIDECYLGIVKDGAGVGRINKYEPNTSLLGTLSYIVPNEDIYIDWLKYVIMSLDLGNDVGKTTIPHIYFSDYGNRYISLVSLTEQIKIADFLDKKCAEIDYVVEETKNTIEEYKKLKQSVITEAVTKGIRGPRPMKDSGIEWIGEIPAEWEISRLKNIVNSFEKGNGITKEEIVKNGNTPCVRYGEIYTKYNHSFEKCLTRTNKELISPLKYFSYGDILVTCTGELVEEIGKSIVYLGSQQCLAGGDIIVVNHSQHPSFLNYSFNSVCAQAQKSCDKAKLKVVHISACDIANVIIALPCLEEQQAIADYLDQKCAEIDSLIEKKTALLEELEAYKKSLIYEYVTGKKEVK